jgi:hypothetical protein
MASKVTQMVGLVRGTPRCSFSDIQASHCISLLHLAIVGPDSVFILSLNSTRDA